MPLNRPVLPFILLIGGSSGSGKSTVALEIRKLLNLVDEKKLLQTDTIRDEMRHSYPKTHLIWRSTYNVADVLYDGTAETKKLILDGFDAQASLVKAEVASRLLTQFEAPLVLEGVHVTPDFANQIHSSYPQQTIAYFLRVPDATDHRYRFEKRGPKSTSITPVSNASEKYFHYFDNIRCISDYITREAEVCGYRVIDNCEFESALGIILRGIVELYMRQQTTNDPTAPSLSS